MQIPRENRKESQVIVKKNVNMKSESTNKKIRESKCCISIEMYSEFEFLFGMVLFLYRALVSVQIQASGNFFLTR